jgi:hypothetical protein
MGQPDNSIPSLKPRACFAQYPEADLVFDYGSSSRVTAWRYEKRVSLERGRPCEVIRIEGAVDRDEPVRLRLISCATSVDRVNKGTHVRVLQSVPGQGEYERYAIVVDLAGREIWLYCFDVEPL